MLPDALIQSFNQHFQQKPALLIRAPGRVNLIGEHTDYNDGFVLPMAIDRAVWIALQPLAGDTVTVYSFDFHQQETFSLNHLSKGKVNWVEYIKGVAYELMQAHLPITAWQGVVAGDIPIGAGLSSSAALEVAAVLAFHQPSRQSSRDPAFIAKLAQQAENQWVGMNCGIMDQMISAAGKKGSAMLLDCRSLEISYVHIPSHALIVVMDTATRRELVDSAYNERRTQCQQVAEFFGVKALRDVSLAQLESQKDRLEPIAYRRARHVITENQRTLEAVEALAQGDCSKMGNLMMQSHLSLRDDYEVSRPELDWIVEIALNHSACYGARMTGAGFGGCAVALVQADHVDSFVSTVTEEYCKRSGLQPSLYVCSPAAGAEAILL